MDGNSLQIYRLQTVKLSEGSILNLRLGICLILEETMLTIETCLCRSAGADRQHAPTYFQREEFQDVDQDMPTFRSLDQGN